MGHRAPILRLNPSRRIDLVDEAEFVQPVARPAPGSRPEPVPSPVAVAEEVVTAPAEEATEVVEAVETVADESADVAVAAVADVAEVVEADDVVDDAPEAQVPAAPSMQTSPIRRPAQRKKIKTRLLGFDTDADAPSAPEAAAAPQRGARYPVGWLVVVEGPGTGEWFVLTGGLTQIGRGAGQTVQLDFGDLAISRENHAAIAYDTAAHSFLLGSGQKKNVVRVNGEPVTGTRTIKNGDLVGIGETTVRLVALCDNDFHWDNAISRGD